MKKLITLLTLAFCLNGKGQIITTVAGNGTFANTGDGGLATAAEINGSLGIIFDKWENCYFSTGPSIRKINTLGIISTIAGTGISGYTGDGGPATMADINDVHQITFDFLGNMYITDAGSNVIRKINTAGTISTIAGNGTGSGFGVGAGGI